MVGPVTGGDHYYRVPARGEVDYRVVVLVVVFQGFEALADFRVTFMFVIRNFSIVFWVAGAMGLSRVAANRGERAGFFATDGSF